MDQYTLKMSYQNVDKTKINELQRSIIKNDIAHLMIQTYPDIMFDLEEVKE